MKRELDHGPGERAGAFLLRDTFVMNHLAPLRRWSIRLALLALVLTIGPALQAATPREELLRFVPADTAFCLLFQGLREHASDLAGSPFLARLARSPLGKAAVNLAEFQQLLRVQKQIEGFAGLSAERLRNDILGDLLVLAYKPGPPGKPEREEGLFLLHARDPRALSALIERINDAQKRSGELKALEERTHHGQHYFRRQVKGENSFYHLREQVLLFTSQEAILLRALDQVRPMGTETPEKSPGFIEASLRRLGVADALLVFWVNPRAFDDALTSKLTQATGEETVWLKTFQVYWKALDGLALAVQLDADATVSLAVAARPEELPASARTFFARLAEPSRVWDALAALPAGPEPLLALTSRLDLRALLDLLTEFLPPESRQTLLTDLERFLGAPLGKSLVREVLPALGPDLDLIVLPPPADQKSLFPQTLLALRVAPSDDPAPVDQALWSALQTFATLVVIGHNQKNPEKPLTLQRITLDKLPVRALVGDAALPAGVQPAFALGRGHLLLASSPASLRRLLGLLSESPTPADRPVGPVPVLRISFKTWREFLTQRRDDFVRHIAAADALSEEQAAARLSSLLTVLEYLDRVEVRHQPAPGRLLLQLSLKTTWPLK